MFIITGGGSGIGRALAHILADQGYSVLIAGRREQALIETASYSSLISICCADVANAEGRQAILSSLNDKPTLKGLIHNAGVIDPIAPVTAITETAWQQTLATNLNAPLFLTQLLLDKLQGGRVLTIGSGAAYFPVAGWATYCVSKAALVMLTRCWQLECNTVAFASVKPGIIDTDMQALIRQSESMDEEKIQFFKTLKAENRLIQPSTVALFLSWLLLKVNQDEYSAAEWDIYETHHHHLWLTKPHVVPNWE
ncbi:yueD sepiapterin reductase [Legionella beliardensis]|uniref:YueD sepiapterin reductase n=1 Tax=Legionella beliardensis TaxID=91822 RepID=A0A378I3H6_9GAMM|nr:SDR family NAD(P)-dependent oxidoreductase [Legionella beliardensis]STX29553.1 yueD sepiapterin reductase [Legionella beliardensis]